MRYATLLAGVFLFFGMIEAGCSSMSSMAPAASRGIAGGSTIRPQSITAFPICTGQDGTQGQCGGLINGSFTPNPNPTALPSQIAGYHPGDLQSAYGLTQASQTQGGGQIVGIVTAFHNLTLEDDLWVYRAAFGLPPCTLANRCLRIISPPGQRPNPNPNWAIEGDLNVEMVSAICPLCSIAVVEAKDDHLKNLASAVDYAAGSMHADVVSNSYAAPESKQNASYESHYHHSNVAIVAGAGDGGYSTTAMFPASSPHVTAVGGTTLTGGGASWMQAVWPSTGSGCSAYFGKPKWQTDTGCTMRTDNDTAAVADPNTGAGIWSTPAGGWIVVGGTSVATPVVAAMFALAGNTQGMQDASYLYRNPGAFNSITGSNGTCTFFYLCNAGQGYNGPAGLGVPSGLGAF